MLLLINVTLKNQHFRVRFWGGGHQKAYAVYAFINVDNCERPLTQVNFYNHFRAHAFAGVGQRFASVQYFEGNFADVAERT